MDLSLSISTAPHLSLSISRICPFQKNRDEPPCDSSPNFVRHLSGALASFVGLLLAVLLTTSLAIGWEHALEPSFFHRGPQPPALVVVLALALTFTPIVGATAGRKLRGALEQAASTAARSQAELLAKVLNMAVAFVAVVVFTWLVRWFRRQQLTFIFTGFFLASYIAYTITIDDPGAFTVWSFYLFGDLFRPGCQSWDGS